MHRWAVCPGSVALSRTAPEQPASADAEAGTLAHEKGATWLQTNVRPDFGDDDEMMEAVRLYVDTVWMDFAQRATKLFIEHKFDLSSIHPGMFGTADAVIVTAYGCAGHGKTKRKLYVYDFKYGAGVYVSVEDNPQLKYYALGALMTLPEVAAIGGVEEVELVIVQPRCAGEDNKKVRRQVLPVEDLYMFAAELKAAAEATEDPNAPLVSGDHCRWCPALILCPEVERARNEAAAEEFAPKAQTFEQAASNPVDLSRLLKMVPRLKAWCEAVDRFAYAEAMAGRPVPGFKLVDKRPVRKIVDEGPVIDMLKVVGGTDEQIYTTPKLRSPAQLEENFPNLKQWLQTYIEKKSSGKVLVPDTDDREPASIRTAADDFTPTTELPDFVTDTQMSDLFA